MNLTRDYLDYAGLLKGTRPLCYGSFTISALIREVDRQFAPLAANRRIDWACSIDKPDTTVSTDASRCQQIFGHLVANALKYTPEGGQIQINGRREGDDWVVIVADNGPGIPQGELDRVFEPFYRLACDENAKIEGTGLGLAICREMIDQMGGKINISSLVGQETRVCVRLPISPRQAG